MTTRREYRCNLCNDSITENSGHGVHFVADSLGRTKLVHVRQAENHVCSLCLEALRKVKPDA